MAIDFGVVGLVGSAIKLSWSIYEKGFSKENSSPQRYIEFGDALHRLHSNLKTIDTIIKAANTSLDSDSLGAFGPPSYDITSLTEIIGNFRLTLEECRDCLRDETKFRHKDGFVTNILYNINVDAQVIHLTERLAFHSTKIGFVLDPFNIHIQTQLRDLHKEQHQDVAELLQELKQLLISGRDPNGLSPKCQIERDLHVPCELKNKFNYELEKRTGPTGHDSNSPGLQSTLSVKDGLEAFFNYFNGTCVVIDSVSYLRLLKSIWIMDQIRDSEDWRRTQRTSPGGLYDRCVREMDRRLRTECSRVTSSRMPLPQLSMLLQLPDESFLIWPNIMMDEEAAQVAHIRVLLDIPVLPDLKSHTLRIVENIDGTLGVEDTTIATTRASGVYSSDRVVQKLNIDLPRAYLVPIYAVPSMTTVAQPMLTVKLQSSRDGINGVTPGMKSVADLFRLQHLITGYQCVKQRKNVKVKTLTRGQEYPRIPTKGSSWSWKSSSNLIEIGNLQLWHKSTFAPDRATTDNTSDAERRTSDTSNPRNSTSLSTSSVMSAMSSIHAQQISLGSSRTAIELKQPEPPRLVLFLKHTDTGQLSFLMIELDERAQIQPNSCDCRNSKKGCSISVLERSGTPLLAHRFYAQSGLNSWNLAALGEHWSRDDANRVRVRDMYWLRIGFSTEEERIKFNNNVADLVRIHVARLDDYRKDLKLVRGTQIIKQAA